jgi:hypothetical protein
LWENDQNWYEYQKGVILHVDVENQTVEPCVEYVSPPEACSPGDPILFKCGTLEDQRLYACTQTEILIYALPAFQQVGYVSLPCFNDVHHVRPTPEKNLLLANSGLEMVLEVTPEGQILREWNVLGEDPWERFSKEIDYRKGINLKPHHAHPNYVFYIGQDIWVTRFEKRDALCLTRPEQSIPIGIERLHDGVLHDGLLYFTTVNGNLVVTDPDEQRIVEVINLSTMHPKDLLLGWCRGLFLEEEKAWIGFSRIRPTKFREAVRWANNGFKQELPTHIACYDLKSRRCLTEINLETHGLNAVFSILPAE